MIPEAVMSSHPCSPALVAASLDPQLSIKLRACLQNEAPETLLEKYLLGKFKPFSDESCEAWLNDPRHGVITLLDPLYPRQLKAIPDPPLVLWVAGQFDLLSDPAILIVGSHHPSPSGLEEAAAFSGALSQAGLTIIGGLNPGIEATAQALALNAVGRTLAVLNHGPDRIYPREFRPLAQSIREKGLLVSEHPPGTRLQKERFPRRNRILSGLSVGVLVVEAELSSPARAIAETALEQGREVFAVPGSIHLPQKKGCHFLIRQGANLVETAEDVLKHLHPTLQHLKF